MNIAVGFFGIHFNPTYKHWMGWNCNVDYTKSIKNYKEKLFINDNKYSFYSSTYDSIMLKKLKNEYNFNKVKINDFEYIKNTSVVRNIRFIETLELIKKDNKEYDFVMITRFDLIFNTIPLLKKINYNKINVLHGAKWGDDASIIDDNWYFFNFKLLDKIIDVLKTNINLHSHYYNKIFDINLLDNNHYYSHENPNYIILR